MHADELDIDVALVRRLVAKQFPAWANLLLEAGVLAGRLGHKVQAQAALREYLRIRPEADSNSSETQKAKLLLSGLQ